MAIAVRQVARITLMHIAGDVTADEAADLLRELDDGAPGNNLTDDQLVGALMAELTPKRQRQAAAQYEVRCRASHSS